LWTEGDELVHQTEGSNKIKLHEVLLSEKILTSD